MSAQNDLVNDPKAGDVYYYKCDTVPSLYSALRVDEVTEDSIRFTSNDYLVDQKSGLDGIDVPKNYTVGKFAFTRSELVRLHEADTIFTIKRKE